MKSIVICLLSALISGCAALGVSDLGANKEQQVAPSSGQQDGQSNSPPSVVEELYAEIDGAVLAFSEAAQLLESGATQVAESIFSDSLTALDDLTARCQAIDGCDLRVALQAWQEIAAMQSTVFRASSPEAPEEFARPTADSGGSATDRRGNVQLNGTDLVELIVLNPQVRNALNGWLTWNRPLLMNTYENYQYLRAEMAPAFDAANMPEALLFGILAVESGGRVHAFSRVGAAGPLQFMRATGSRYGLRTGGEFDERLDPARAAQATVDYLNDQLRQLDNSLEKVLAAYNSGENRVKRLHRRTRGADFWSSEFYYALPRETREYVPKVLAAAWLYLHPDEYNLVFPEIETELTELVVEHDQSLGELAICLGNEGQANGWFRTLRNLNPKLKPEQRVTAGATLQVPKTLADRYAEHCGDSEMLARSAELYDATYGQRKDLLPYVVQRGDTLSRIASRHRCMSMLEIASMNNIPPPRYPLRAGKTIKVPNC